MDFIKLTAETSESETASMAATKSAALKTCPVSNACVLKLATRPDFVSNLDKRETFNSCFARATAADGTFPDLRA